MAQKPGTASRHANPLATLPGFGWPGPIDDSTGMGTPIRRVESGVTSSRMLVPGAYFNVKPLGPVAAPCAWTMPTLRPEAVNGAAVSGWKLSAAKLPGGRASSA